MRVIVIHPGKQHAYNIAQALHAKGCLCMLINRGYIKSKYLNWLENKLPKSYISSLAKRNNSAIPDEKVFNTSIIAFFLLKIFSTYFSKKNYLSLLYWMNNRFQKKVAKKLANLDFDILISFDTASHHIFNHLREFRPEIKLILDISNPHFQGYKIVYKENIRKDTNLRDKVPDYPLNRGIFTKLIEEEFLADHLLVASSFAKECMIKDGVSEEKISVLPYGSNNNFKRTIEKEYDKKEPEILKFLFVGRLTTRKGISYLLPAFFELLQRNKSIQLQVVGQFHGNKAYTENFEHENIDFLGPVYDRKKLHKIYEESHVFIMPSLADGFGFVFLEALQLGLPIIGTTNSGAADMINQGENGYVISPFSKDEIKLALLYFIENRHRLKYFSECALSSAEKYTWSNYSDRLNEILKAI